MARAALSAINRVGLITVDHIYQMGVENTKLATRDTSAKLTAALSTFDAVVS
jgi:hypothetical protein